MDKMDVQIMGILQKDGSRTNASISREIGVSEETVRRRLKNMHEDEVYELVAIPDPVKMGFECQVFLAITASPERIGYVADVLAGLAEITSVTITTGGFNIVAWVVLRSATELHDFLALNVNVIEGIDSVHSMLSLLSVKQTHGLRR